MKTAAGGGRREGAWHQKCLQELLAAIRRAGEKGYEPLNWHTSVTLFGYMVQKPGVYADAYDPADDASNLWRRWSCLNGEADRIPLRYIEARKVTD